MNMMLASVTERTREIGVRMSVGASARAVQAQFLVESVMLCVLGGLAGVAASAAGPSVVERVLGWEVDVPVEAVLLALGFSGTVGVLFGFYAALRAARGHRAKGETRGPETSDRSRGPTCSRSQGTRRPSWTAVKPNGTSPDRKPRARFAARAALVRAAMSARS